MVETSLLTDNKHLPGYTQSSDKFLIVHFTQVAVSIELL